jgi:hypothetical protein
MSPLDDRHLDRDRWMAMLEGRASQEDWEHLREQCERCEAFLATLTEADQLDGALDDSLLRAETGVFDEVGFARVLRAIDRPRRRSRVLQGAGALAALAATITLFVSLPKDPEWREKGSTFDLPSLRLEALRVDAQNALTPLGEHGQVSVGDRVVFRVHLDRPGCLGLWAEKQGVSERLLSEPLCFEPGDHVIAPGGQVAGLLIEPGPSISVLVGPLEGAAHPESFTGKVESADRVELLIAPEVP